MGPAIFVAAIILIAAVWMVTRNLPRLTSYGARIFTIGMILGISGLIIRQNQDGLYIAGGALLSYTGISFIVLGIVVLIRAYLLGEFK